jgi:hypothetical protein
MITPAATHVAAGNVQWVVVRKYSTNLSSALQHGVFYLYAIAASASSGQHYAPEKLKLIESSMIVHLI